MLAFGLLFPIVFGFIISSLIISRIFILERLALAYSLGFGFLTLGMFFLDVLGVRFSLPNTVLLLSCIIALSLVCLIKKRQFGFSFFRDLKLVARIKCTLMSFSLFEKVVVILLGFFLFSNIITAIYWPVHWWDSLVVYDFRAKVFTETQSFSEAALKIVNPDYVLSLPPMTSLVHTWLYLCGWANPKIFYPFFLISLATIFYYSLRGYTPRNRCLVFTLILVTVPPIYSQATGSYTNFPFAFYFGAGTLYLYRWMSTQKKGLLLLAGIFLGLSSWVRKESSILFLGYLAILLLFSIPRRRYLAPLLLAFLYFSIEPLWRIYINNLILHSQPSGIVSPQSTGMVSQSLGVMSQFFAVISQVLDSLKTFSRFFNFGHWKEVLIYLQKYILNSYRTVLFPLILSTLLCIDMVRKHFFLFLLVFSNLILFLVGTYIFSLSYPEWASIGGSASRLFMMFLPIIWYYIALITTERKIFKRRTLSDRARDKDEDIS